MELGFGGLVLMCVAAVAGVGYYFYREVRAWLVLARGGATASGTCTGKTEEPDDGGYTRTLFYEFRADCPDRGARTYRGKSWVPRRVFRRLGPGSPVRIRYWRKNPRVHRLDEDDYRDWGFRSEGEAGGDVYPDSRKSGWDP